MRVTLVVLATAAIPLAALRAQPAQTPDALSSFEVVSVKLSTPSSVRKWEGGPVTSDPTHYRFTKATIDDLIVRCCGYLLFQISSKTSLFDPQYDIEAKVPPGATKEQFAEMLKNLLIERFQMKAHVESKIFPAFELTVAKSGPKLERHLTRPIPEGYVVIPSDRPGIGNNIINTRDSYSVRLHGQQEPISALARMLRPPNREPVVDRTGLTGLYDFLLDYDDGNASYPTAATGADLFHAVEQQLGLKLVPQKLPFDVFVIDSINKTPVDN